MDFSLPCMEEGREVTLPPLPGSLLSRQPPVKTHDHHSLSLYHHNVPHPHRLTISYVLKFMTSSQCRNWFSVLWFPFASEAYSDFYFWWQREYDVLEFCTLQLHLMLPSQIWWYSRNTSSCFDFWQWTMERRTIIEPTKWLQISISTLKCYNKYMSCLFKVIQAVQGLYSLLSLQSIKFTFIGEKPEDYALQWFGIGVELITGCLNKALLSKMTGWGNVFDR